MTIGTDVKQGMLRKSVSRVFTLGFAFLGIILIALPAAGIESDDFNTTTLNTAVWTFVDPVGDCALSMVGTGTQDAWVQISTPAGVDHDVWSSGNRAPRIMQAAANTDFEVEVKYESIVNQRYQLQGVTVEQDSQNFVRCDIYYNGSTVRFFAATFSNLTPTVRTSIALAGGVPAYMRVNRSGSQWTISYSYDGSNWTVGSSFSHTMTVTSIGPMIGNAIGSSSPAYTGQIDYFFDTSSPITPEDSDVNHAPSLTAIGNQSVDEESSLVVGLESSDFDGGQLTLTVAGLPSFASFVDSGNGNGSLDINPVAGDAGNYIITVTSTDTGALFADETFTVSVREIQAPTFTVLSPPSGGVFISLPSLSISFSDIVGLDQAFYQIDDCSEVWTSLWAGNSGVTDTTISWQIPTLPGGLHTVHFLITDDAGNVNTDSCSSVWSFTYDMTSPPSITSLPDTTGNVGQSYAYDVHADGDPAPTYALTTFPAGMIIDGITGQIDWSPVAEGLFDIVVSATNGSGVDNQSFAIDVTIQVGPGVNNVQLDASSPGNLTTDDLTATYSLFGSSTVARTAIMRDGSAEMALYLPVEGGPTASLNDLAVPGAGLTASSTNGPTFNPIGGQDGFGAFIFDGVNDYLAVGDAPQLDVDQVSLAAWVYLTSYGEDRRIITKEYGTSQPYSIYTMLMSGSGNRKLQFRLGLEGQSRRTLTGLSDVPLNQWVHVAATFDGIQMVVYINGTVDRSMSASGIIRKNNEPVYIGASQFYDPRFFAGSIDDIRIYGHALSPEQIASLYTVGGDVIVAAETNTFETWQVYVTPFDDSQAGLTVASSPLFIEEVSNAPLIISTPVTVGAVGKTYIYDVNATGSPTPTFSLTTIPAGMTIDAGSGMINWTPGAVGTFPVVVTATNSAGTFDQSFSVTVNESVVPTAVVVSPAPGGVHTTPPTLSIDFGDNVGLDRAYYQIDGCVGSWTEIWSYNSGATDTSITWTAPDLSLGLHTIFFKVSDDFGNVNSDTCITSWSYTYDPPIAPIITSTPLIAGWIGQTYSYNVEAGGNPPATYTLTLFPTGMTIDGTTGVIVWTPASAGSFDVTVTATNSSGGDSQSFTVVVTDVPPFNSLVSDEFNGPSLDTLIWTWVDGVGDCSYTMVNGGPLDPHIQINVPGGIDHDTWDNGIRSPRIMQAMGSDDFEIEVKFDSPLSEQYQLQGIVVEQDANNYLRFDFLSMGRETRIFAASILNLSPTFQVNRSIPTLAPQYMRLKRQGNEWTLKYSFDGQYWSVGGVFTASLNVTAVGPMIGNAVGSSSPAHTGMIDYFRNIAPATPSMISIWGGTHKSFGQVGTPQNYVSILGNLTSPQNVSSLVYSLNGGSDVALSLGPDNRRLLSAGDFCADIHISDLQEGTNTVVFTLTDLNSNLSSEIVTIDYTSGNVWPLPYSVEWDTVTSFPNITNVIDGRWAQVAGGVRTSDVGYDRLLDVGDITWDNYEMLTTVTLHSWDSTGFNPISWNPGIGFIPRWTGHTDSPVSGWQPKSGWLPSGAIFWYGHGHNTHLNLDNLYDLTIDMDPGSTWWWRMRVESNQAQGGGLYSLKVWLDGTPEPAAWNLVKQRSAPDVTNGSMLIIAHHADLTIGDFQITPIGISNVQVTPTDSSALISWTTAQPATSSVAFGPTTAYENGSVSDPTLTTSHSINLSGLSSLSTYHYQISSVTSSGGTMTSLDMVFQTEAGAVNNGILSDDFSAGTLDASLWTFVDPLNDATLSFSGAGTADAWATISVPAGVDHDVWASGNRAPRLMQAAVDVDFEIETKFESALTTAYQLNGMIIEQDSDNFVRTDFYHNPRGTRIFVATFTNLSPNVRFNASIPAGPPMYLRVTRTGDQWQVSYSYDGSIWTTAVVFTHTLNVTAVGPMVGNAIGSSSPEYSGSIDYFFNTAAPITPEDGAPAAIPSMIASTAGELICCDGQTGNVDGDPYDEVNILDLVRLINYMFGDASLPVCKAEANIDGDPGENVDIADLSALADYLFNGGTVPADCGNAPALRTIESGYPRHRR